MIVLSIFTCGAAAGVAAAIGATVGASGGASTVLVGATIGVVGVAMTSGVLTFFGLNSAKKSRNLNETPAADHPDILASA